MGLVPRPNLRAGRQMCPVADRIPQRPEPFQVGVFDGGFVEAH